MAVQCGAKGGNAGIKALRMRMRSNEVCRYGGVSRLMGTVHAETSTLTSSRWGRSDEASKLTKDGETIERSENESD